MTATHALCRSFGFVDIEPYPESAHLSQRPTSDGGPRMCRDGPEQCSFGPDSRRPHSETAVV